MIKLKKKAGFTILAAVTLLGAIMIPAVFVQASGGYTAISSLYYAMYCDNPAGSADAPVIRVDDGAIGGQAGKTIADLTPVTVWVGGGNSKRAIDKGVNIAANAKTAQLTLYSKHDSLYDATTAKGVLWAISNNTWLDLDSKGSGYVVKKNEYATVSKGKVTAGKKLPDSGFVYVIAYKMNYDSNGKIMKFTAADKQEATQTTHPAVLESYQILGVARVQIKQAVTIMNVFESTAEVAAYEASTTAKTYKVGEQDVSITKVKAKTLGIGEKVTLYVAGIGGVNSTAEGKPAISADDSSTYTVYIEPDKKTGLRYAELYADFEYYDKTRMLNDGIEVKGAALAPKFNKNGEVTGFAPGKSTLVILNNQSGKVAKVTFTVTNGIKNYTPLTGSQVYIGEDPTDMYRGIEVDSRYMEAENISFQLLTGKYATTTGKSAADIDKLFAATENVEYNTDGPIIRLNGSEQTTGYELVEGVLTEVKTNLPLLVKPLTAVYYDTEASDAGRKDITFTDLICSEIKKASAKKLALPKPVPEGASSETSTEYQTAVGYRATMNKDNSILTLSIPKIKFAANDYPYQPVYVVAAFGTEPDNILIQKLTIKPRVRSTITLTATDTTPAALTPVSITEGIVVPDTDYTLANAEPGKQYTITLDENSTALTDFTISKPVNVTVLGNKVTLKDGCATGEFKVKVRTFTYTIKVTAPAAPDPDPDPETSDTEDPE